MMVLSASRRRFAAVFPVWKWLSSSSTAAPHLVPTSLFRTFVRCQSFPVPLSGLSEEVFSPKLCCSFGLDKLFFQFVVLGHIFWIEILLHALSGF